MTTLAPRTSIGLFVPEEYTPLDRPIEVANMAITYFLTLDRDQQREILEGDRPYPPNIKKYSVRLEPDRREWLSTLGTPPTRALSLMVAAWLQEEADTTPIDPNLPAIAQLRLLGGDVNARLSDAIAQYLQAI